MATEKRKTLGVTVEDEETPFFVVREARKAVQEARESKTDQQTQLWYIADRLNKVLDPTKYLAYKGGSHIGVIKRQHDITSGMGDRLLLIA